MPSQNELIHEHSKVVLIISIIKKEKFNVGEIIGEEILLRTRQDQTSLSLPMLITQLCERLGVPFQGKTYVRITPVSSNYIWKIEAEYLWDDVSQRKPPQ